MLPCPVNRHRTSASFSSPANIQSLEQKAKTSSPASPIISIASALLKMTPRHPQHSQSLAHSCENNRGAYPLPPTQIASMSETYKTDPDATAHTSARDQLNGGSPMPPTRWTYRFAIAASVAVLAVATWCSAQTKEPPMLSPASFAKAKDFILTTGRPLDRARFRFHFEQGSARDVITELAKFQNPDGGFVSYLESDSRWTGSSPNGTRVALKILTDVRAPSNDPHVQAVVKYLLATFDEHTGTWHALPKEANAAPHAPWWHVHEDTGKSDVDSPVFPTAALAGYLQPYDALLPRGFLKRITDASLKYLANAPL